MILVTLAYMEGWTYGRTVTKIKLSDGFPYFPNFGAPRAINGGNYFVLGTN